MGDPVRTPFAWRADVDMYMLPGCGGRSDDHITVFIVSSLPDLMAADFSLLNYDGAITLDYKMTVLTKFNAKLKSIYMICFTPAGRE